MANREAKGLHPFPAEEPEAHALAARMPALLIEAQRVAHTVTHGSHGRRRAGPGETFWQFRHFDYNDFRAGIDWRRSGSSDHLFVRERRMGGGAHRMAVDRPFALHAVPLEPVEDVEGQPCRGARTCALRATCPRRRACRVLGNRPYTGRNASRRVAEILVRDTSKGSSLPPPATLSRFSECLLFSDFLEPVEETAARIEAIAGQGVRGHLVQILDPAEETFPTKAVPNSPRAKAATA